MKQPVLNGTLDVGHRPKFKDIPTLPYGLIVTCLQVKEGGSEVASAVRAAGKKSIWLPFVLNDFPHDDYKFIVKGVDAVVLALKWGWDVFIHCSAGYHRTGVVAYAVLRRSGLSDVDALQALRDMRPDTAQEMQKFMPIANKITEGQPTAWQ